MSKEENTSQQDKETLAKVKAMMDEQIEEGTPTVSEPVLEEVEQAAAPETEEERLETERNTTFDGSNVTQGSLYAWSMMSPELGNVEVTDTEKARYLKAALNDKPVILPIELEMGDASANISVELRTLSNYETDVVFVALEKDREDGKIQGHHQLATRLQQYAGALQTVKFQERRFEHIKFSKPGDVEVDAVALRDFVHTHIGSMGWPRWQAIMNALKVFETKIKICNDAALNGNFWKPQDVDS